MFGAPTTLTNLSDLRIDTGKDWVTSMFSHQH